MTQPETCPIDPAAYATLEDVADGDVEFMIALIHQYLDDAVLLVDSLALGLASGDAQALERAAHTLKSASANVGAMSLSRLCERLQRMGQSRDLGEAGECVPAAEAEFVAVKRELELRLAKLEGQG